VQRTRLNAVAALEEYEKQPSQDPKRLKQLLKEVIIILFHSVQPPDRVGVALAGHAHRGRRGLQHRFDPL
jgi:hypothetical protein